MVEHQLHVPKVPGSIPGRSVETPCSGEQGVLDVFHGSAGGWAGGGPTDPSGSMEQKEADVHRLDHILRGEVGISCNSMPLEHNLLVTG